jgi:hypothetical protein
MYTNPYFLIRIISFIFICSSSIDFFFNEFLNSNPMDLGSILNPSNPSTEPLENNRSGGGGGGSSNVEPEAKEHKYDTSILADHLDRYKGLKLSKAHINLKGKI